MKKFFLVAAMFAVVVPFVSCGNDDDDDDKNLVNPNEKVEEDASEEAKDIFVGTIKVTYNEADYATQGVQSSCEIIDDNTLKIALFDVKFVPQMPLTLNIEVPSVSYEKKDGKIVFRAESVVPNMLTEQAAVPVEKYLATDLKGELDGDQLTYSLVFGTYPTAYQGARVK